LAAPLAAYYWIISNWYRFKEPFARSDHQSLAEKGVLTGVPFIPFIFFKKPIQNKLFNCLLMTKYL